MMAGYSGPFDSGQIQPDEDAILDFLQYWFGDLTGDARVSVGWYENKGDKLGLTGHRYFDLADLDECAAFLAETNKVPGQSIYFRPALIAGDKKYPTDEDAVIFPGVWADLDKEGAAESAPKVYSTARPTSATITGRTPHKRAQLFWKFDEPVADQAQARELCTNIKDKLQGDGAVVNPSTYMRVPHSIAWPIKKGRTAVEYVEGNIYRDRRRMTADEVARHFPASKTTDTGTTPTSAMDATSFEIDEGGVNVRQLVTAARNNDHQWHDSALKLVAHWVNRGWSDDEIQMAAQYLTTDGYTAKETYDEIGGMIDDARKKWGIENPTVVVEAKPQEPFKAEAFSLSKMKAIKQREWLYGTHLIAGFISCTVSPGGVGKTTLALIEAISICLGRGLIGTKPARQAKVLHINLEDPEDELYRRVQAICDVFQIDPKELEGRLFINSGRKQKLVVADLDSSGNMVATPAAEQLKATIEENDIGVIQIDPFIKCHYLDENMNKHVDFICGIFADIADKQRCAFDLIHHVRKPPSGTFKATPGDMDTARGGSALIGAVRAGRTITVMSDKEAEAFGIPIHKRKWYIRVDDGKGNMTPPAEKAFWLERVGVQIETGDDVGALRIWTPPDAWGEFTYDELREVLANLQAGVRIKDEPMPYSPTITGQARCPLQAFAAVKSDVQKASARTIMSAWFDQGVLEKGSVMIDRKERAALVVHPQKYGNPDDTNAEF